MMDVNKALFESNKIVVDGVAIKDKESIDPEMLSFMIIAGDIGDELTHAKRHGKEFVSAHEAHSVIQEEFEEFWEHVKKKRKDRCGEEMRKELIQLAAMAVKAIQSLPNFVGGKV